jgi:hypothetical protein
MIKMFRTEVSSSSINSLGYSPEQRRLEIQFRNGRVYQFFDVPMHLCQRLADADSKGRFFNERIKPFFRAERVTEE